MPLDTLSILDIMVAEGAGRGEEPGAPTAVGAPVLFVMDGNPQDSGAIVISGLKVLNEERIRQIDDLLHLIMQSGHGELRLVVKNGKYRWVIPSVSLEAAW